MRETALNARLRQIGIVRSRLTSRKNAPKQGDEGGPDAWLEVRPRFVEAIEGITPGDTIIVVTWLHQARRDVLRVHPRDDAQNPIRGVFATRSADRPNPLGLHTVTVKQIEGNRLRIGPIEAIDGTPVVDIKPTLRARTGGSP
jgi:tRNA-Thr(GGU) m(6)t(6)A37 methyltransferase TsaA